MPPKLNLPRYVHRRVSKGRAYYSLRIKGEQIAKLPSDPESAEFHAAYASALLTYQNGLTTPLETVEGSLAWLIEAYKASDDFVTLKPKTRRDYDRELERLRPIEAFQVTDIRRRHINAIRNALNATPRTKQLFGQVCSKLFNYGILEEELDIINPAQKMTRGADPDSFVVWTPEQMEAFERSSPARYLMTAYMIARYTGPRRGDIVGLRRNHYDGAGLTIENLKVGGKDRSIWVPCHPKLKAYLDGLPATFTIVADEGGNPVTPDLVTKHLRRHLDGLGFTEISLHGLRHTAGKALAEAGCSPHEIKAVLGHATLQMVENYTSKAEQRVMAKSAILKLQRNRDET